MLDRVGSLHSSTGYEHPSSPDLCLVGGQVVDVRAGVLRRAAVAISGRWIAAVGSDDEVSAGAREIIDVSGQAIVPGYIEPHTHIVLANPVEFIRAVLPRGTTTAVTDALPFMLLARADRLPQVLEDLSSLPLKLRWQIRLHPPSFSEEERFSLEILRPLWRLPSAAAVGEVTRWTAVLDGEPDLIAKIRAAQEDGKRVEGHAPGASFERLAALAAAGFTSCHEAITAQEAADRLRAGLYTMLRHSSIRPDLPELAAVFTPELASSPKLMLTADGPTPLFIEEHGYMEYVVEVALRSGIPPLAALRMVTLNPAAYYGMNDIGEVAAGKRADLNILRDLSDPRPAMVIAEGQVVARGGRLAVPISDLSWKEAFEPVRLPRLDPRVFSTPPTALPACRFVNDVITEPMRGEPMPEGLLQAVLIDRHGRWMTRCLVGGFVQRLGGLATTLNTAFDLLVVGQSPEEMAQAAGRVADLGGGLVVVDGGEVFALPFDAGPFSSWPWPEVVDGNRRFNALMRSRGFRYTDPIFSLLFLTFDSLPWIRLTSRGVWDVRSRRVLTPSSRL